MMLRLTRFGHVNRTDNADGVKCCMTTEVDGTRQRKCPRRLGRWSQGKKIKELTQVHLERVTKTMSVHES